MQAFGHRQVKTVKNQLFIQNCPQFFKNCPQAVLACLLLCLMKMTISQKIQKKVTIGLQSMSVLLPQHLDYSWCFGPACICSASGALTIVPRINAPWKNAHKFPHTLIFNSLGLDKPTYQNLTPYYSKKPLKIQVWMVAMSLEHQQQPSGKILEWRLLEVKQHRYKFNSSMSIIPL